MKIVSILFGLVVLVGVLLPFHLVVLVVVGVISFNFLPDAFSILAVLAGIVELFLYYFRVPCMVGSFEDTVQTFVKRPHDADWKLLATHEPTIDEDPFNWVFAAMHSFFLAGLYLVLSYFDLFSITL